MGKEDHFKKMIKNECLFESLADVLGRLKFRLKKNINRMTSEEWEVVQDCILICKHLSHLKDDFLYLQEKYQITKKKNDK